MNAEQRRLDEDANRTRNWKRWGPYLAERQWATVREDYSPYGTCWDYFPHDQARSRAYRWGEDGLLGFTDREERLCFAIALWNEKDTILKERLFGLTGSEGNHGEDVKEEYFYLDSTPTHSYCKALYKYPQAEFPYGRLVEENRSRNRQLPEFELVDTGVFDESRYFDVMVEYAKEGPNDLLIRITVSNRGPAAARVHLLPTLWFRNTWVWGCSHEGCSLKPRLEKAAPDLIAARHETLGELFLSVGKHPNGSQPALLFTENETNYQRLYNSPNMGRFVKDGINDFVIHGRQEAVNPKGYGTKVAPHYVLEIGAGASEIIQLRLYSKEENPGEPFGPGFDKVFKDRIHEADLFYQNLETGPITPDERNILRQGYAGLLWSKQFYHFVVSDWLDGDPNMPTPPVERKFGRNRDWTHVYSRDIFSMPDKWEYPWFAAWDLAFHMVPFARIDPEFAKQQLVLLLREWYMHPNGQMPAYEFAFNDVNPPVHAWAAWRVYKICDPKGKRDRQFLESVFQKLLVNFTWWVNRKDPEGNNLFSGGFLGLDNIGVFDRSQPLPGGACLIQADATAWMAFYCSTMLSMAIELAMDGDNINRAYEDMASKFLEHFVQIADSINTLGGTGLWNEEDGFYYDHIRTDSQRIHLRSRSLVGLLPLVAVEVLSEKKLKKLGGFYKRLQWFLTYRKDLAHCVSYAEKGHGYRLLAIPSRHRLEKALQYMLDESEFLSAYGIRSVSKYHEKNPYIFQADGTQQCVEYVPGEGTTKLFGGNSNWRGPIWFPINYLLIEALERYHHFYGEELKVEFPTGSGTRVNLKDAAELLYDRLLSIFMRDEVSGQRPCFGKDPRFRNDPHWQDLLLFHEFFHAENGRGLGASHQTGWTALVVRAIEDLAATRKFHPLQGKTNRESMDFNELD